MDISEESCLWIHSGKKEKLLCLSIKVHFIIGLVERLGFLVLACFIQYDLKQKMNSLGLIKSITFSQSSVSYFKPAVFMSCDCIKKAAS